MAEVAIFAATLVLAAASSSGGLAEARQLQNYKESTGEPER